MTENTMTDKNASNDQDNPILRFAEALDRSIAQRRRDLGLEPLPSILIDLNALMKKQTKSKSKASASRKNTKKYDTKEA